MNATTIADVRTVAVAVTDQDRAIDFYVDTLGFDKRLDAPVGDGLRWIEVAPPGARTSISLTAASGDSPAGVDTGIRFTTTRAATEHAAMRDQGVDVDDLLRWPDTPPMFAFRDLDGNTMYVVEASAG